MYHASEAAIVFLLKNTLMLSVVDSGDGYVRKNS